MRLTLIQLIDKAVIPKPKPAVCISGGIDSTIVLHHLTEKTNEEIHTYYLSFEDEKHDTAEEARQIAEHYGTVHHEVFSGTMPEILELYEEVIPYLDRPNFDLWVYPLAKQISRDGHLTVYTGDGMDEHFGGYWYRGDTDYLEDWANCLSYQVPSRVLIYSMLGLQYECPLLRLNFKDTLPYYDPQKKKRLLRDAYTDVLPRFVVERRKDRGGIDYWKLWTEGLKFQFPTVNSPKTDDDIRMFFHFWAAQRWLKHKRENGYEAV